MSDSTKAYKAQIVQMGDDYARREAVSIALDLIHADIGSSATAGSNLDIHLGNLSQYADLIEAAAKNK